VSGDDDRSSDGRRCRSNRSESPNQGQECTARLPVREGSLKIAGGRRVEYCQIGEPDAPAVLYCHGTPGSRLEPLLEAGLMMQAWDFDPMRIDNVVRFWHGGEDTRVPARVATEFAARLPNASAVQWPRHGHFSWAPGDESAEVAGWLARGTA
jgi:hypothetical protein